MMTEEEYLNLRDTIILRFRQVHAMSDLIVDLDETKII
jgi:hypothetical protein